MGSSFSCLKNVVVGIACTNTELWWKLQHGLPHCWANRVVVQLLKIWEKNEGNRLACNGQVLTACKQDSWQDNLFCSCQWWHSLAVTLSLKGVICFCSYLTSRIDLETWQKKLFLDWYENFFAWTGSFVRMTDLVWPEQKSRNMIQVCILLRQTA